MAKSRPQCVLSDPRKTGRTKKLEEHELPVQVPSPHIGTSLCSAENEAEEQKPDAPLKQLSVFPWS